MSLHTLTVTDASFEVDVTRSSGLLLLDFWAPWCGPCKTLAPLLDELADEFAGRVRIAKINADENPQAAARCEMRNLPTLILFKDGEVCERLVGLSNKSRLAALLERHLEA